MPKENCQFAYRKRGDASIHCKKINGNMDYCAHQYFCPKTQRWEATEQTNKCPLRNK